MKPIGLFFGSFNPLHNGHLGIARYLIGQDLCRQVWLVVSPCNPLKQGQEMLPEQQRLSIVQAAVADDPRLVPCDIEFTLPKPSYTIDTLRRLSAVRPDCRFSLIIGADNLRDFHRWRDYQAILRDYEVLVYPRQGVDVSHLHYPNVTLTEAPLFPISSTEIRELIASGQDISPWVPEKSLPLILAAFKAL